MTGQRRVAITGLGTITPLGIGIEPLWEGLMAGRCGLKPIEAFDASGLASRLGGEIPGLKAADHVPKSYRKSVKVMARDIEIAVAAAHVAVLDAGLNTRCLVERGEANGPVNVNPTRFGANIGAGLICADLQELAGALYTAVENGQFSLARWGRDGMNNLTPLWLLKFLPNMLGCHVTIVHDAQAPSRAPAPAALASTSWSSPWRAPCGSSCSSSWSWSSCSSSSSWSSSSSPSSPSSSC